MEITEAEGEVGNEFTLSDFKQVKGFTAYEMRDWEWFGEANSSGKVSFENYKSDDMITGFPKKCAFDKLQSVELAVKITLILYH